MKIKKTSMKKPPRTKSLREKKEINLDPGKWPKRLSKKRGGKRESRRRSSR